MEYSAFKKRGKDHIKKPLLSIAMIAVLAITIFFTPSVKAVFEGLFEFTKVERNKEVGVGWSWSIVGDNTEVYNSLSDIEKFYSIDIPFPQKLITTEKEVEGVEGVEQEYIVSTEKGQFLSYQYKLWTKERYYNVIASNVVKEKPKFNAATNEKTVVDKEIIINGVPARLLGIYEMKGYYFYIEKGNWSMIISDFANSSDGQSNTTEISEEEMIKIAKTINW